jgi:hypothetical protein
MACTYSPPATYTPSPSIDIRQLLNQKERDNGWYDHLEAWSTAGTKLQEFVRSCYSAILEDVQANPGVRPDGAAPQFHVQLTEGICRRATPYGGMKLVNEL